MTGLDTIVNNSSIHPNNSSNSNNYWSYPLQPQHSQMSINAEEPGNNNLNININNINQDDSGLFGIGDYYNENDNNNNPLFQQLQQNPGLTVDTLILNLNSIINNEK